MVRKNILEGLEKAGKLSPDGRAWLTQALDPFHDQDIQPAGYPDVNGSHVVCVPYNQSITIQCPTSVTTGTWDAHVFTLPEKLADSQYQYTNTGLATNPTNPRVISLGTVTAISMATGFTTFPSTNVDSVTNHNYQTLDLGAYAGTGRVVAMGFEVINTTAEIYKQGDVICYRQPQSCQDSIMMFTVGGNGILDLPSTVKVGRLPPNSFSEAIRIPNSKLWAASEGGYVVCTQFDIENQIQGASTGTRGFVDATARWGLVDVQHMNAVISSSAATTYSGNWQSYCTTPFNTSGLYFSGLSLQTTLQVNVRYFLELVPSSSDTTLVSLSRPSPVYDPLAFEIYSSVVSSMPPGCMWKENPAGEWFNSVLNIVAENAPSIGNLLSNVLPGASAIGNLASQVAKHLHTSGALKPLVQHSIYTDDTRAMSKPNKTNNNSKRNNNKKNKTKTNKQNSNKINN